MTTEIRNNGLFDVTVLIASEGKVFRRIGTNEVFSNEFPLGYSYYIEGVKQDPPHLDVPEDFEEIYPPEDDDSDITDEEALRIITEGE